MLSYILYAILMIQSGMSEAQAQSYATTISIEAEKAEVSPLVMIGIIQHESEFKARAISKDGEDYGLLQIRARNYGGNKEWLLNATHNIRVGAYLIKKDIEFCERILHRKPLYQEWMACYTGSCTDPQHYCKPTHLTQVFEDYLSCLTVDALTAQTNSKCQDIYARN
jgi:hypothetical protein